MRDGKTILQDIVIELTRIQGMTRAQLRDEDSGFFRRKLMLGDGRAIQISQAIRRDIALYARHLHEGDRSLLRRYTSKDWSARIEPAFGLALSALELDDPLERSVANLKALLDHQLRPCRSACTSTVFAFGCVLLAEELAAPIVIGPVSFLNKAEWLRSATASGRVQPDTALLVQQHWAGQSRIEGADCDEETDAGDILKMVGRGGYVCTVNFPYEDTEMGRNKALLASRLAMTALALTWERPNTVLQSFRLSWQGQGEQRIFIGFCEDGHWNVHDGRSRGYLPVFGPFEELAPVLKHWQKPFDLVGECLDLFLDADARIDAPTVRSRLFHALMWFSEGCETDVPMLKVSHFGACLDSLTGGKGSQGIEKLVEARLGLDPQDPVGPENPTVHKTVERIYNTARSQISHGSSRLFSEDWSKTAQIAEQLAGECLTSSLFHAANHSGPGEADLLLR